MAIGWQDNTWGEIATLEYGKSLRDYVGSSGKFPVFGTNGQIGWHTEALYEEPSVIVGRKGAYRGIHYSRTPFFVIDTAFYLKPKINFDTKWAYYELLTHDINAMASSVFAVLRLFSILSSRVPRMWRCSFIGGTRTSRE